MATWSSGNVMPATKTKDYLDNPSFFKS